jgi:hypothetical protein
VNALVQVALPYELLIVPGEQLEPLQYEGDATIEGLDEFQVLVGPPYRSRLSERETEGIVFDADLFNPVEPQPVDENVTVKGVAAVRCDAILVQIVAEDFDRRQETAQALVDSLLVVVCNAINGLLQRLRVLARATHMKPVTPDGLVFRVVVLDDSGALVDSEEGKWRQLNTSRFKFSYTAVTRAIWDELVELGEYETPPWDELLLDATDPDVELGPSLLLASTAVETRVAKALDALAEGTLDRELWSWINDRDDDYTKTPSVSEQLDLLLKNLGGRSLKDDPALWQAWVQLRQARNSFVHEGRALLGKKTRTRTPVTRQKGRELVVKAGEIIDFIEALLPEDKRRPQLKNPVEVVTTTPVRFSSPQAESPETSDTSAISSISETE